MRRKYLVNREEGIVNSFGRAAPLPLFYFFLHILFAFLRWNVVLYFRIKLHSILITNSRLLLFFRADLHFLCELRVFLYAASKKRKIDKMYFRADLHFLCEPSVYLYAASKKMWSSRKWWAQVDSNHRPHAYQACALTTWAMSPCCYLGVSLRLVPSSFRKWWRWTGSNRWPPACKAGALPAELHPRVGPYIFEVSYSSFVKVHTNPQN